MSQDLSVVALDHCFEESYNNLFKVAYKLSGNRELAQEIIQDTYLKARAGWAGFNGRAAINTWLYRITVNCTYQHMKQIKKLPIQLLSDHHGIHEKEIFKLLPRTNRVEEEVLAEDLRERCLSGFIRCLPAKQRIAFTLKIIMGLSSKDSADIMETTTVNVKVLVHRARKYLQGLMENRCSLVKKENPCQCQIWVAWALEKGLIHQPLDFATSNPKERLLPAFYDEMSQLQKIQYLLRGASEAPPYAKFKETLKTLIDDKNLKILS